MLYTTDGANQRDNFNLLGLDANVIATARGTGSSEAWYLYNKDTRGSTSSLIDASGTAAAAYEYDEFGNTTIRAGEDFDNEICYTGQVYDKETGLYYYNARFLTQDTYRGEKMEPDTLHLYAYCANNPINYVDPSGHAFIRVYSRNSCANTYRLLKAMEWTAKAISWTKIVGAVVRKAVREALLRLGVKVTMYTLKRGLTGGVYSKFKNGFYKGGFGFLKVKFSKKSGRKKMNYEKFEKIKETKFIYYTIKNFKFYYKSKSKKWVSS